MTLEEGIKTKGLPHKIDGVSRNDFPLFLAKRGYKVGAEIGVFRGKFCEQFCKAGLKMYAIDPWMAFAGQSRDQTMQENQDLYFKETCERLAQYDCKIMRRTSMNALRKFRNRSLDFVYIDGDHTLPNIINDIWWWSAKVRSGGIISGHDFFCTAPHARNLIVHVQPAVEAVVKVMGIESYWLFGEKGNFMNGCLSWMWIKP